MADDTNEVFLPYRYYPDPTKGRPVYNGSIYVGEIDEDPVNNAASRKSVSAVQEDGTTVSIEQPISISAGGVPVLNGSPVQLVVDGEYSIAVLNSSGSQVYYAANLVAGQKPTIVTRTQVVPSSFDLSNRLINNVLFQTNISFADYYALNSPTLDLGDIGDEPFDIENIPTNRFDLAQGDSTTDLGVL